VEVARADVSRLGSIFARAILRTMGDGNRSVPDSLLLWFFDPLRHRARGVARAVRVRIRRKEPKHQRSKEAKKARGSGGVFIGVS
jgi:hypothetical protein